MLFMLAPPDFHIFLCFITNPSASCWGFKYSKTAHKSLLSLMLVWTNINDGALIWDYFQLRIITNLML